MGESKQASPPAAGQLEQRTSTGGNDGNDGNDDNGVNNGGREWGVVYDGGDVQGTGAEEEGTEEGTEDGAGARLIYIPLTSADGSSLLELVNKDDDVGGKSTDVLYWNHNDILYIMYIVYTVVLCSVSEHY